MKPSLPAKVKVTAALMLCGMLTGVILMRADVVAAPVSARANAEIIDVSVALQTVAARPQAGVYLPPVDHREFEYINLREASHRLSDLEVLFQYDRAWEEVVTFKQTIGGGRVPEVLAQEQAMPLHALWREIQQRGLVPQIAAPEFDAIWTYINGQAAQVYAQNAG